MLNKIENPSEKLIKDRASREATANKYNEERRIEKEKERKELKSKEEEIEKLREKIDQMMFDEKGNLVN